ncbi:uncharacterized protein [Miscanthus floridulus]|uniref:uncharacterized protein n=1 Tax=Miscanthus floridulus TaxID=154761 RepID=UPI0034585D75
MKVKLRARRLWNDVDKVTDNEEDNMSTLEAIIAAVPAEYREPFGAKSSAKEAWEAITAMSVGSDRAKKDGEMMEDFSLRLQTLINKLKSHGIALSIETMLDLSTLTIEDVTGRLRTVDERLDQATTTKDNDKLLLIEEKWAARRNSGKVAFSSHVGDGKRRGKASSEKKKQVDPNAYRRCHCPDDDVLCIDNVEAEERKETTTVEGPRKTLKAINLDEHAPKSTLDVWRADQEQRWYLDSGASNHMTGSKASFSELDDDITDTVKFGDGSRVTIQGRVTIIFRCQNGEQRVLTDVYYIPQLRSSIISISQLDERDSEVLIKDKVLRIREREQRLIAKVKRSLNWLYLLNLKDEEAAAIKKFKMRAEAESGNKLHVQSSDRGDEFTSVVFAAYCADQGVVRHHTTPYSPQQNGMVKRWNQMVVGMAQSMMKAKGMLARF